MEISDYTAVIQPVEKRTFVTSGQEVEAFLEAMVELNVGGTVPASKLYAAYAVWSGPTAMTHAMFGRILRNFGIVRHRVANATAYRHLALKPQPEATADPGDLTT